VPSGHWKSGVPAKGAWAGAVDASRVDVLAVEHFAMLEPPNDATVGRWLSAVADGTRGRG
jgi:thioesterase domain-containing protein